MTFVSLQDVLAEKDAAEFHARLHNARQPPQWFEIDAETGWPLHNDAVRDEGMMILKHLAGRPFREQEARNQHVWACLRAGLDPNKEPRSYNMSELRKFPIFRPMKIGFDREELEAFLNPVEAEQPQNAKGIQATQEARILKILTELDYDPHHLPKASPGKPGVKAEVRKHYSASFKDYTLKKFDKAWERLNRSEKLNEAE